jgi:hypothetical protein
MRYSASEKFEIIELVVEQSSLSIPRTLAPIGIPRSTSRAQPVATIRAVSGCDRSITAT